jgi:hypothetical protein
MTPADAGPGLMSGRLVKKALRKMFAQVLRIASNAVN